MTFLRHCIFESTLRSKQVQRFLQVSNDETTGEMVTLLDSFPEGVLITKYMRDLGEDLLDDFGV